DVDKVEHHIRIASQNARLAQQQYNTLLIAHSENPNILRQYSVLMRDLYEDDRLGIKMLCEADLMDQGNKIDLLKNEDELGQNKEIWNVDADQTNQQLQGEQNQNKGQDWINQTEDGKTLQKFDSLADRNTLNNKSQIQSTSQSASDTVRAGSQKAEILKKLQTKQTRQSKTFILIFSFLFISLLQMKIKAERGEIVAAEYKNIALDYSRYYIFSILTLDQDAGSELDAIYEEAQGVTYPLLMSLNQEYHQLYEWAHNKKEWRTAKAIWNDVKLQNITTGKICVGPDMEITKSTSDELRLTRYIQ
ncbi:MAG: hypothetical protein EZS28_044945, partial [Streblomastix strix]